MCFCRIKRKWLADKASVKVVEKSRRVGLTWAQAHDDTLLAATSGRYGMDVLYISSQPGHDAGVYRGLRRLGEASPACGRKGQRGRVQGRGRKGIKAFRIDFASGRKILALSNRPSNLRGKQGRVIIDEAAFVEDLPELFEGGAGPLDVGRQVIIISTHNGADNAFNQLVQDVRAGNLPYSPHRITLDDALHDGLYRRICQVTEKP